MYPHDTLESAITHARNWRRAQLTEYARLDAVRDALAARCKRFDDAVREIESKFPAGSQERAQAFEALTRTMPHSDGRVRP